MPQPTLTLHNFAFSDLFHTEGLTKLDGLFLTDLRRENSELYEALVKYRAHRSLTNVEVSHFLLALAPFVENFITKLFKIEQEVQLLTAKTLAHNPISTFKNFFVVRRAKKNIIHADQLPPFAVLNEWLIKSLEHMSLKSNDLELAVALLGIQYLSDVITYADEIDKLTQWCVKALTSKEGQALTKNWSSFSLPKRLDYEDLVHCTTTTHDALSVLSANEKDLVSRDGFHLTDARMTQRKVQDEVNYCIYCHDNNGDFCSKGFPVKKNMPELGFKKNPLDITLTGCPLEEKISEMNLLKQQGFSIASLAVVMIDNPMCPATGHRICNDCMKSCIYQKQDPVNIPEIETRVLTDVLDLPWGVEIYDLLTRWNPLRNDQWIMKPYNGLKVMIAGMGPAGFTLAHHLLMEGFAVVGFDGLKIEPLPKKFIHEPIYQFKNLLENLEERTITGFGGVAEYGITVRWDKNFLKLIYISLMRKPCFQVFGSIRFGGTITVEDAFAMGFDHFAIAVGAGLPKALNIPNSLAKGMRQANDFLMALQLGSAFKKDSLTNLQIRLPAVIIGGGLTAVDTATEVQAYYISQVEKMLARYELLVKKHTENEILKKLNILSKDILEEYLLHGQAVREERKRAHAKRKAPNFIKLIREFGGVTIIYRQTMQKSPAYILNHEELQHALNQGIYYLPVHEPKAVKLDQHGYVKVLICRKRVLLENNTWETLDTDIPISARAIFVATGTQPNIAYEFEHRGTFNRLHLHYQHYEIIDDTLVTAKGNLHCKEPDFGPFTSYHQNDKRVSLIGDTHPVFHGSVVKAIASAKNTYPKIAALFAKHNKVNDSKQYALFKQQMDYLFNAKIKEIKKYPNHIVKLTITAPLAARKFQPGQFFRLQNYEAYAPSIEKTKLIMEPLAVFATNVDAKKENLEFIIFPKGATTRIASLLKENELVSLMGPTGVRAKISENKETILIVGDAMSIPLLLSYGTLLRKKNNTVWYIGYFANANEIVEQKYLEEAASSIIWVTSDQKIRLNLRPTDQMIYASSLMKVITDIAENKFPPPNIALKDIDRLYAIGDYHFLTAFRQLYLNQLKKQLVKEPKVFGSVYTPMQCMLKGVCAQCLQWQIDKETGARTKAVFACSWSDQPLELIDLPNLKDRQMQNELQEQITNWWVDDLLIDLS